VGARRAPLISVGAAIAVVAALVVARAEAPAVVVSDRAGKTIASLPLPDDGRFSLRYRHSIYEAPAFETFEVDESGRFDLVELSSTSGAVLDYYALEGDRHSRAGWLVLRPDRTQSFETLPLIATATGRRTLVVGGRRLPLYEGDEARHLALCIRNGPSRACG
jgi:Domain of unknown function (DUF1850)